MQVVPYQRNGVGPAVAHNLFWTTLELKSMTGKPVMPRLHIRELKPLYPFLLLSYTMNR